MVNEKARKAAADLLRHLTDGTISVDKYESQFPRDERDPALRAICVQMWLFYSDTTEFLSGEDALGKEDQEFVARSILFLNTGFEFAWPQPQLGLKYAVARLLGFGWLLKRQDQKAMSVGDVSVWPFLRRSDYEEALAGGVYIK